MLEHGPVRLERAEPGLYAIRLHGNPVGVLRRGRFQWRAELTASIPGGAQNCPEHKSAGRAIDENMPDRILDMLHEMVALERLQRVDVVF